MAKRTKACQGCGTWESAGIYASDPWCSVVCRKRVEGVPLTADEERAVPVLPPQPEPVAVPIFRPQGIAHMTIPREMVEEQQPNLMAVIQHERLEADREADRERARQWQAEAVDEFPRADGHEPLQGTHEPWDEMEQTIRSASHHSLEPTSPDYFVDDRLVTRPEPPEEHGESGLTPQGEKHLLEVEAALREAVLDLAEVRGVVAEQGGSTDALDAKIQGYRKLLGDVQ